MKCHEAVCSIEIFVKVSRVNLRGRRSIRWCWSVFRTERASRKTRRKPIQQQTSAEQKTGDLQCCGWQQHWQQHVRVKPKKIRVSVYHKKCLCVLIFFIWRDVPKMKALWSGPQRKDKLSHNSGNNILRCFPCLHSTTYIQTTSDVCSGSRFQGFTSTPAGVANVSVNYSWDICFWICIVLLADNAPEVVYFGARQGMQMSMVRPIGQPVSGTGGKNVKLFPIHRRLQKSKKSGSSERHKSSSIAATSHEGMSFRRQKFSIILSQQ